MQDSVWRGRKTFECCPKCCVLLQGWLMPANSRACHRLIPCQGQRCVGVVPAPECGYYSQLWYIYTNTVSQLHLEGKKRLNKAAVAYLCCLLTGSLLQVSNCLKPSLPNETRHFYCLLLFLLYLSRNLAFTFSQWEGKLLPATPMGLSWLTD